MARHIPARGHSGPALPARASRPAGTAASAVAVRDLTSAQSRFLRGQAHDLKALLQVGGKGLTAALVAEVEQALEHHELIKVKLAAEDRDARKAMAGELARRAGAALVQQIGHVAVLYRPSQDHRRIVLPRA